MNTPSLRRLTSLDADDVTACRKGAWLLALLFFLLYVPSLASLSQWRGDERFYTDAAIGMAQSGDYLTPVYPDGSLRFKKPILPYWGVLMGFKLFGYNFFASRIVFLTAGALVVGLCFELCLALIRQPGIALAATAMLASNLTMQGTSMRSTPDILLCLFDLASLTGFVHLLFHPPQTRWYALAYVGAGLAMATKGLSGILPVLYVFLFAAICKRPELRLRNLLHPIFSPLAGIIGGAWFFLAFTHYGRPAMADFFGDQVGQRLSGTKTYILANAGTYLSSFVVELLPWSLFALLIFFARRQAALESFRKLRQPVLFAVGWILFLWVIFSCGNIQRTRYFLPAYPFLALIFALPLVHAANDAGLNAMVTKVFRWLMPCVVGAGLLLAVSGIGVASNLIVAGILLAVLGSIILGRTKLWAMPFRLAATAFYIMLLFAINLSLIEPVFDKSAAPEITRRLTTIVTKKSLLPMAGMDIGVAAQLRVLSAGQLDPRIISVNECEEALQTNGLLICTEAVLDKWPHQGLTPESCASGSTPWKLKDYLALCLAKDRHEFLQSKFVTYYLVRLPPGLPK